MISRAVVDRGLVTPEELEAAENNLGSARSGDPDLTLTDMLVDQDLLTRRQVERIRREFDAEKSSQRIPGFKIIRKLGAGAMATVFLARQLSLDRFVAIKVLPRRLSSNADFIDRFYREGRAAAKLNDPNIVAAYDVGQAGEHHYFVMEFVDGETIYDRIVREKRLDEREAIEIVRQVASALRHAHARGFIHRDIKPKNIMLGKSGVVKLADLGLARAMSDKEAAEAEAGRAFGTPFYISPEQIRGRRDIGVEADIYGLGATFYHMVTGRVPYEGRTPTDVMHRHLKDELVPPDHVAPHLTAGTAQIIEMMLAKDPRERYRSAEDLLEDLDLVLAGRSPRHAGGKVDISSVAQALTRAATGEPVQTSVASQREGRGILEQPVFLVIAALLSLSVIVNLILVAVLSNG